MHPPRYTRAQAAELVGKDLDTLKRWKRTGVYAPKEQAEFGSLRVDLYTDDDIAAMREIARTIRPGRHKSI